MGPTVSVQNCTGDIGSYCHDTTDCADNLVCSEKLHKCAVNVELIHPKTITVLIAIANKSASTEFV